MGRDLTSWVAGRGRAQKGPAGVLRVPYRSYADVPFRPLLVAAMTGAVWGAAWVLWPVPVGAAEREPTPSHIEGPYYKPNTPLRTSLLEKDVPGIRLVLRGHVLSIDGTPIPNARLDFWQADASGVYDNEGYRLRGHQYTDEQGRYALETIVPGNYPGRTSHIHVTVQAPGRPALTTQLFMPDDPRNRTDWLYKPGLLMQVQDTASGKEATFDFVLKAR